MVVSRSSGVVSIESSTTSSTLSSRATMLSKANLRRRRSKGTIAGFASSNNSQVGDDVTKGTSAEGASASNVSNSQGNPQTPESSSLTNKPCHSAKLALMCCQNAIRMGVRTQLGLCPPGRARRSLKVALRQKSKTMRTNYDRRTSQTSADTGGYFGVDRMVGAASLESYPAKEEEFLMSTNTFDMESDEEASSGDDDDLLEVDELMKEDSPVLDDEKKYDRLSEPLFTSNGAEGAAGAGTMSGARGDGGKLPFNRRKLRYFDSISAVDTTLARSYLQVETRKSKQNHAFMITKQLRRVQREQKRKLIESRGGTVSEALKRDETDTRDAIHAGVSRFEHPMTPSTAAALVVESLSFNPLESIEGMAKCYEGIVAAGVALLDSNRSDPTSPVSHLNSDRPMANRTEIKAALTPLLITSLEQTSGEVILGLARIRRMCGTARYQRRFVQRVVPSLIRPPNGAIWCLKHQNDMEPILAAAELIFDCAMEIFSKGWYERGQLLLADTKRAQTLNTAAMQLRNLNAGSDDHLTLGGSLTSHAGWRTTKFKDSSKGSSDQLAEWEVIAVDRQIKISISNLISMDWPKVVPHTKDSDAARALYRPRSNSMRAHARTANVEASPKAMVVPPPQSPARGLSTKTPKSPHGPPAFPTAFPPDSFGDHAFPTSFPPASSGSSSDSHIQPPPPPPPAPPKALSPTRESDAGSVGDFFAPSNVFPPRSPKRDNFPPDPMTTGSIGSPEVSRRKHSPNVTPVREQSSNQSHGSPLHSQFERTHLSPASSPTTNFEGSHAPQRPFSSASSIGSATSGGLTNQSTHYRMVMSTAAERKRTVAACRALRSQILRFEDAFIQMHGRAPRGAAERAPLATTYAQYKEWKRAIRADAACRIQALVRGALTRGKLSQSSDAQMQQVISRRAGRSDSFGFGKTTLEQLQIPADIGESDMPITQPDPFTDLAAKSQPLPPQWGSNQSIRRPRTSNDSFASPVPKAATSSPSSPNDINRMSLPDLQARKRDLKQQLKQYDMNFARRHKRMPVKAEKEPIRHLYEQYNALKSQITTMEQEGRQSSVPSPVAATPTTVLPQRTISPVSGLDNGGDESPIGSRGKMKPARSPPAAANSTAGPLSQDLAALKTEKGRLHQMLRSYEKDFYKEHKRQVSSFADIRPVANQYRRYKEIKKAIAALQQSGDR
ncbi:unnamed protein product [Cylindrotheca closterium]|uniref:FAM13A-like domain-containing protein n=1 Tax=Cylindrotheca closterium TaxID=2856 RepID=A0AAD2GC55_9STRA|nr:unnamed protein product [Cylindrotheca closterium]